MKSLKLITTACIALAGISLSTTSLADRYHDKHYDRHHNHHSRVIVSERVIYAPVTYSRPIYRTVAVDVPVESCRVETTSYREGRRGDSFGGTLVGGLIGAAIGNEIGHGGGRSTAVGGIVGAAIGNDIARGGTTRYADREVCSTAYRTEYRQELVSYDIGYSYGGRIYHTERHSHPGTRIRLDVNLRPY